MERKIWTEAEMDILKRHYYDMSWNELFALLPDRSQKKIYNKAKLMKLKRINSSQFQKGVRINPATEFRKGHEPFNKGKKISEYLPRETYERILKTSFKKGNLPPNTKHDYAITQRFEKSGKPYYAIRVALGKWEYLSRWMWKQQHGEIPKGMNVAFKDNNPLNCVLENLFLETRQQNLDRNRIQNIKHKNPELHRAIYANIHLKKAVTEINKKK